MNNMDICYIELVIAIIEQAVKDYKQSLKSCDAKMKRDCERFFLSEWGQLLTDGNGRIIIERCRREERGVI